jgi:hypothetical protein
MIAQEEINKNYKIAMEDVFKTPKERPATYFPSYLNDIFQEYRAKILEFDGAIAKGIKKNEKKIDFLISKLLSSIYLYYDGKTSVAFNEFKEGVDSVTDLIPKHKKGFGSGSYNPHFYRVRKKGDKKFTKGDLFHVPFEKRYKVATCRYSIPGYPCLYMSDSILAAWVEMGKPDIDTMYAVRFDMSFRHYLFLDFSLMTNYFNAHFYKTMSEGKNKGTISGESTWIEDDLISFITLWPLIAACSIKVLRPSLETNESHHFKPEYIHPQMLLEWVRLTESLDGIKYVSSYTHTTGYKIEIGKLSNYVIPAKRIKEKGYCEQLAYDLPLSEPISMEEIKLLHPKILEKDYHVKPFEDFAFNLSNIQILNDGGRMEHYQNTIFGKIESSLLSLKTERLHQ